MRTTSTLASPHPQEMGVFCLGLDSIGQNWKELDGFVSSMSR